MSQSCCCREKTHQLDGHLLARLQVGSQEYLACVRMCMREATAVLCSYRDHQLGRANGRMQQQRVEGQCCCAGQERCCRHNSPKEPPPSLRPSRYLPAIRMSSAMVADSYRGRPLGAAARAVAALRRAPLARTRALRRTMVCRGAAAGRRLPHPGDASQAGLGPCCSRRRCSC